MGGNLEPELDPSLPPFLDGQGPGPSCRSAAILYVENKPVYLLGTSTGLYATKNLDGDSTIWVQQGTQTIGNAIVDMIDVRQSDGFVALGTHGSGVYTAFINSLDQIVGYEDITPKASVTEISVYPNPARSQVSFRGFETTQFPMALTVYDHQGKVVLMQENLTSSQLNSISIAALSNGFYSFTLRGNNHSYTGRFIVGK